MSKRVPAPRSLGVVGNDEFTAASGCRRTTILIRSALATYAVSLEPAGGSPSGAPTGPVLFKGNLIQSVTGAGLRRHAQYKKTARPEARTGSLTEDRY